MLPRQAKLGYSRIKIDHIADSLLKLQIKIINVELSQLLIPGKEKQFKLHAINLAALNSNKTEQNTLISLINVEVGINVEGVQKLPNH